MNWLFKIYKLRTLKQLRKYHEMRYKSFTEMGADSGVNGTKDVESFVWAAVQEMKAIKIIEDSIIKYE